MDGYGNIISAGKGKILMTLAGGAFQSVVRLTSGNEIQAAGLTFFPSLTDQESDSKASLMLHQEEISTGRSFPSDTRRRSFIQGRIAGKMAMNQVFPMIPPAGIRIITGSLGDPLFQNLPHPYGVTIAHSESWNTGLCFPLSVPMGIDVEGISGKNGSVISSILSGQEKAMCDKEKETCSSESDLLEFLHVLWTAKEAAGKSIRLGFRVPHEWYEITCIDTIQAGPVKIRRSRFKQISQFSALSVNIPDGILSIAFPAEKNLERAMISLLQTEPISSTP